MSRRPPKPTLFPYPPLSEPALEKAPPLVHGGEALEDLVVIGPVARADHAPQVSGVVAVGKEHPDSPVEAADPLKLARPLDGVQEVLEVTQADHRIEASVAKRQRLPLTKDEVGG